MPQDRNSGGFVIHFCHNNVDEKTRDKVRNFWKGLKKEHPHLKPYEASDGSEDGYVSDHSDSSGTSFGTVMTRNCAEEVLELMMKKGMDVMALSIKPNYCLRMKDGLEKCPNCSFDK